jgi:hypothetical protein
MKLLLSVVALVAGLLAVGPAVAQPLQIIVPGGFDNDSSSVVDTFVYDDYVIRTPVDPGGRFDPGQAAINAINVSHFWVPRNYSPFNVNRAVTLNATGDSLALHQLKCQAAYDTYDLVSDTYIADDGLPRPCRF